MQRPCSAHESYVRAPRKASMADRNSGSSRRGACPRSGMVARTRSGLTACIRSMISSERMSEVAPSSTRQGMVTARKESQGSSGTPRILCNKRSDFNISSTLATFAENRIASPIFRSISGSGVPFAPSRQANHGLLTVAVFVVVQAKPVFRLVIMLLVFHPHSLVN